MKKFIFVFILIATGIILFSFSSSTYSQDIKKQIQETDFKQKWVEGACGQDNCTISSFIPPYPLSMFYKERSVINVNIISRGPKTPKNLKALINQEIKEIKELNKNIIRKKHSSYSKQKNTGITSWVKTISGRKIGFIKYRVPHPDKDGNAPVTITQVMVMADSSLYFVHLITFFKEKTNGAHDDMLKIIEKLVDID